MSSIEVTDPQLEQLRRAIMQEAARDLRHAAEQLEDLAEIAPWPVGTRSSDTQNAVAIARESLDILDALGWPRDESRREREARMRATAA